METAIEPSSVVEPSSLETSPDEADLGSQAAALIIPFRGRYEPGHGFVVEYDDSLGGHVSGVSPGGGLGLTEHGLALESDLTLKITNLGSGWAQVLIGSNADAQFWTNPATVHPAPWNSATLSTALLDCQAIHGAPYVADGYVDYLFPDPSFPNRAGILCASVTLSGLNGPHAFSHVYAEILEIRDARPPSDSTLLNNPPPGQPGHDVRYLLNGERVTSDTLSYWDHNYSRRGFEYPYGTGADPSTYPELGPNSSPIVGERALGVWEYDAYQPGSTYSSTTQWVFGNQANVGWNFNGRVVALYEEREDGTDVDFDGAVDDGFACGECCIGPSCNERIADCPAGTECLLPYLGAAMPVCADVGGEVTDGVDNDCDGDVDETPGCGQCCPEPFGNVCDNIPTDCGVGSTCVGSGSSGTCQPDVSTEISDGLDNDCNGWTDDGVACGVCCHDVGVGGSCPTGLATSCETGSFCGGGWFEDGTCTPLVGTTCGG